MEPHCVSHAVFLLWCQSKSPKKLVQHKLSGILFYYFLSCHWPVNSPFCFHSITFFWCFSFCSSVRFPPVRTPRGVLPDDSSTHETSLKVVSEVTTETWWGLCESSELAQREYTQPHTHTNEVCTAPLSGLCCRKPQAVKNLTWGGLRFVLSKLLEVES